jgi:RNA 2',3'-cyclic 3'-phosphodiesterase
MLRFFVALPLPDEAKDRLIAVQPPAVQGMRLLGRDELHLTLHFLGEVAPHDFEKARNALANIKFNAFEVTVKGIGKFPPDGETKVLWAGAEGNANLIELHRIVGAALTGAIGFRCEDRPYSPHITLARINETVPSEFIDRYLDKNKGFVLPSVRLDCFALYSSDFAGNMPKYKEEAVLRLHVATSSLQGTATANVLETGHLNG